MPLVLQATDHPFSVSLTSLLANGLARATTRLFVFLEHVSQLHLDAAGGLWMCSRGDRFAVGFHGMGTAIVANGSTLRSPSCIAGTPLGHTLGSIASEAVASRGGGAKMFGLASLTLDRLPHTRSIGAERSLLQLPTLVRFQRLMPTSAGRETAP